MRGRECVVAAALVVGFAAPAAAEKTRRVKFESNPPGATIYLGGSDSQPIGETPFEKELEVGSYQVIAELDAYSPDFQSINVKKPTRRDKKKVVVRFSLQEAVGVLKVTGPKGARIVIDNVAYGNLPEISDGIPIPIGPHTVEAKLEDKVIATEFVVITEEKPFELAIGASGGTTKRNGNGNSNGNGDGNGDTGRVRVTAPPTKRTGPIITAGPIVEVGWRRFRYENETRMNNLEITQGGASIIGLTIDVNPFRLTSLRPLHPVGLVFVAAHGFIPQQVTDRDGTAMIDPEMETFWQRFQASLKYRLSLGQAFLEGEGGYAAYIYRFSRGLQSDIDRLPDAGYHTVQLGARVGAQLGVIEPYVGGESRIVVAGGALEDRYDQADADGYAGRIGFVIRYWKIAAKVEGSYSIFTWSLENLPGNIYDATGATDRLFGLSFVAAFAY